MEIARFIALLKVKSFASLILVYSIIFNIFFYYLKLSTFFRGESQFKKFVKKSFKFSKEKSQIFE